MTLTLIVIGFFIGATGACFIVDGVKKRNYNTVLGGIVCVLTTGIGLLQLI